MLKQVAPLCVIISNRVQNCLWRKTSRCVSLIINIINYTNTTNCISNDTHNSPHFTNFYKPHTIGPKHAAILKKKQNAMHLQ